MDMRQATGFSAGHLTSLSTCLPAASTVIIRLEPMAVNSLVAALRAHLQDSGLCAIAHIVLDASDNHSITYTAWGINRPPIGVVARAALMRLLSFCSEAARAGTPLSTVELLDNINKQWPLHRVLHPTPATDWSELCQDLQHGFVYEQVLHSTRPELEGTMRDSFAVEDDVAEVDTRARQTGLVSTSGSVPTQRTV